VRPKNYMSHRIGLKSCMFSLQETEDYLIFLYFLLAFSVCSETYFSLTQNKIILYLCRLETSVFMELGTYVQFFSSFWEGYGEKY
jgi:hypothetical protein